MEAIIICFVHLASPLTCVFKTCVCFEKQEFKKKINFKLNQTLSGEFSYTDHYVAFCSLKFRWK